jgi:hypothetical protein
MLCSLGETPLLLISQLKVGIQFVGCLKKGTQFERFFLRLWVHKQVQHAVVEGSGPHLNCQLLCVPTKLYFLMSSNICQGCALL